jgi:hypothetical protein
LAGGRLADKAAFVTGAEFAVDGGLTARQAMNAAAPGRHLPIDSAIAADPPVW